MIRVRFAPSPTGYLHVGGARTALFNWLLARRQQGTFVLRIEDTDTERSSWEMVSGIVDGLRWLGLDWDEGPDKGGPHEPYFQSQRLNGHRTRAERLVAEGRAYHCYSLPKSSSASAPTIRRGCRESHLLRRPPAETERLAAAHAPRAIRFRVPDGQTTFRDLVRGVITFDNANIEDFVILRSDTQPTYHLSVVADDIDMEISHVVRGDDHISNTPKQVLLYNAFDRTPPQFAHVPLILGPDKKRLSKRHGASGDRVSASWISAGGDGQFSCLARLVAWRRSRGLHARRARHFLLDGISGGNAVFNPEKLDWFNRSASPVFHSTC